MECDVSKVIKIRHKREKLLISCVEPFSFPFFYFCYFPFSSFFLHYVSSLSAMPLAVKCAEGRKEGRRDGRRIANRMRCCCITRYCMGKLCIFCSAAGNIIVWLLRHHTPPRAPLRRSARKGPLCRGRRSPTYYGLAKKILIILH